MKKGKLFIGTSGWHYKHWIGTFYPPETKAHEQFLYYQKVFDTVELNNSFYKLPSPETFAAWRQESPDNFLFVIKASRYITHQKKLKDPEESTERFFENIRYLKHKLGPVLFQLPPSWNVNPERFRMFLKVLPARHRYVFEFRNPSWYSTGIISLLKEHHCAFCIYELAGHQAPEEITADFVYIRLHGPGDKYEGSYSRRQLMHWADKCRSWQRKGLDVFVYFDNDQFGYAPENARVLKELLSA